MRKRFNIRIAAIVLACACALASMSLCGCLGFSKQSSIAATVDEVSITEDEVTSYIEGFRQEKTDRETASGWAQWLSSNGFTAESLREYVLNNVFIPKAVIRTQAKNLSLEVTEDELDQIIQKEKSYYEERTGVGSWDSVLASYGYDEDKWRDNERDRLLEERLKETVVTDVDPTPSQYKSYGAKIASKYNSKHSYFIAFDSQEDAEEALSDLGGTGVYVSVKKFKSCGKYYAKIAKADAKASALEAKASEEEAEATQGETEDAQEEDEQSADSDEKQTSTQVGDTPSYTQVDGAVNAGWAALSNSIGSKNKKYPNALNELAVGKVSDVIDMENGEYVIILCDDNFVASAKKDAINLSKVPEEIAAQIKKDVKQQLVDEKFEKWLDKVTETSTVVINSMPSNVSYKDNQGSR